MKILLSLFSIVFSLCCMTPSFSATKGEEAAAQPFHKKRVFKIPGYRAHLEMYLRPAMKDADADFKPWDKKHLFDFNIVVGEGAEKQTVGALYVEYVKTPDPRFYKVTKPIVRIHNISVGEVECPYSLGQGDQSPLQKQGYGSMALETIFSALRKSPDFGNDTMIFLEAPTYVAHLVPWYKSFGFTEQFTPAAMQAEMVSYMAVKIGATQFPYFKKTKPKKEKKPAAVAIPRKGHKE